jgi:hypothetical protein
MKILASESKAWEVVLDGDMGYDIVGAFSSWKEAHKSLIKWLKDFTKGFINPDEEDNSGISSDAKRQDKWALRDVENAKENERWSFHFSHDDHSYTLCLQPVGYKEDN